MSSTSNVQNLLVNVFRPTYRYDTATGTFAPSLSMSNISDITVGRIQTGALTVTDSGINTFLGCNAGYLASNAACNVGIGYNALAGGVNISNNIALGFQSLEGVSNSSSNVAIGSGTDISANGNRNILIGTNVTLDSGSNNILIGTDIARGAINNKLQIGKLLYGDLCSGFIGVNLQDPSAAFDISGITVFRNKVGFQVANPEYSLHVAGSVYATDRFLGSNGTAEAPLYSFRPTPASGMYVPTDASYGVGAFGISVQGAPAAVFTSNKTYFYNGLDVCGLFSAQNVAFQSFAVTNGSAAGPSVTFSNNLTTGLFLENQTTGTLGVTAGGQQGLQVFSNGDVSLNRLLATQVIGRLATTSNQIGGVTFSNFDLCLSSTGRILGPAGNSNQIGGVTFSNSDLSMSATGRILAPIVRNALIPSLFDISQGNISNSGTTRSANFLGVPGGPSRPAYAFTTDLSSGMDLAGTSYIAFETGGIQRMCISGDIIGIGTAVPNTGSVLDVSGRVWFQRTVGTNTNLLIFADSSYGSTTAGGRFGIGLDGVATGSSSGSDLVVNTYDNAGVLNVSRALTVQRSNGNIAIGRTPLGDPSMCLITPVNRYIGTGRLYLGDAANASPAYGSAILEGLCNSGTGACDLLFYSRQAGTSATDMRERMRIVGQSGFVGIGTTSPGYLLDVSGTMAANSNEYTVYADVSQTIAVPSGFTKAFYILVGAGGGGGGTAVDDAGAGGGGSGFIATQLVTSISTFTVVIGRGGSGGGTNTVGGRGGSSTIAYGSITAVAPGGYGGNVTGGGGTDGGEGGRGGSYGGGGGGGLYGVYPQGVGGYGRLIPGENGKDFDWLNYTSNTWNGGAGGGASSNGGAGEATGNWGGGGGGGGPAGGRGGGTSAPTAGGPGCGGGGGSGSAAGTIAGAAGGNGYAIIKFLR